MYRIFGPKNDPHSAAFGQIWDYLHSLEPSLISQLFITDIAPALWHAAEELNIDGVGLIAQSALETNWGKFTKSSGQPGAVKLEQYNTAGIKVRHQNAWKETIGDLPLAHQMFVSWQQGARAHAQHIFVYAGGTLPDDQIVDPRWWLVYDLMQKGRTPIQMWSDLGNGNWTDGSEYGRNIEKIMDRMRGIIQ